MTPSKTGEKEAKMGNKELLQGSNKNENGKSKAPNALTIAYRAVYGIDPSFKLEGKTGAPKRMWRGLEVDANLLDVWLDSINEIEGIEIVSTEEGENICRPAHVVFHFTQKEDVYYFINRVVYNLNGRKEYHALHDIGNNKRPRIVVAGHVMSGSESWKEWWVCVAHVISSSINEARAFLKKRLDKRQIP